MFQLKKAAPPRNARSRRHTDKPLTNMLIGFYQDEQAFIADKVFPTVTVQRSTDFYYRMDHGYFNRNQMAGRARGADPTVGNFDYERTPFNVDIFALSVGLSDEDDVDMDEILEWDMDAVDFLRRQAMLQREITFNEQWFKPAVWGTDFAGVANAPAAGQFRRWSDDASDPVQDIKKARNAVLRKTGILLNTLTLDFETKDALLENPSIIDRINRGQTPGGPAKANMNHLKELFEVDEIHVGYAIENSAAEGVEDADGNQVNDHDFVMNNGALMTYTPSRAGKRIASSGYNFVWDVYSNIGMRMRKHRKDLALTDLHIIDDAYAQHQVAKELGVYFGNTGTL